MALVQRLMRNAPVQIHTWLLVLLMAGVASLQLPKFEEGTGNVQGELTLELAPDPTETVFDRSSNPGGPTTCVIARVTNADLPYVESFLRHYTRLGVNTIYLFNEGLLNENHVEVVPYLSKLKMAPSTKFKVIDFKEVNHDDPIGTKDLVPLLEEDFVLNVDMDEFWILPDNITDLPALLQQHPADIYFMRWVILTDDELQASIESPYTGHYGFPGKWMANVSMMPSEPYERPFGHHTVPLELEYTHPKVYGDFIYGLPVNLTGWSIFGRPLPASGPFEPGYMAHLWGRSFTDTFLKIALRDDGPCQPLSEYNTQIDERLATLAFLTLNQKDPVTLNAREDMFEPDIECEIKLALKAACEKDEATAQASLDKYHSTYLEFKKSLAELMEQGAYPTLWPTTALTQSLAGFSVTDWLHSLPLNITE